MSENHDRHLWDYRWVRDLLIILAVALIFYAAYVIRSVTAPILLGFGLAYVFNPLVCAARRYLRWPRWVTTAVIMVFCVTVAVAVLLFVVPPMIDQASSMVRDVGGFVEKSWPKLEPYWKQLTEGAAAMAQSPSQIDTERLKGVNYGAIAGVLLKSLDIGVGAVGSVFGMATYLILVAVIVSFCFFFFSWRFEEIVCWFKPFVPANHRERTYEIAAMMDKSVAAFIRGRLIQATVMGIILSVGWWLAGVPYWLLMGMGCGMLNLVPYAAIVGCVSAVGLAVVHAMGNDGFTWAVVIWPCVVYLIAQLADGWVVEPVVQGKATNLDPLTVMLAVIIGGSLAGLLGMLLAIPFAACGKILAREVILPELRQFAEGIKA